MVYLISLHYHDNIPKYNIFHHITVFKIFFSQKYFPISLELLPVISTCSVHKSKYMCNIQAATDSVCSSFSLLFLFVCH